jgi:hypothetical protein
VFRLFVSTVVLGFALQTQSVAQVKSVDAADLAIGSKKYAGKTVRVNGVRCYFADTDDYRCTSADPGSMLSVFSKKIEPEISKQWIQENCDTLKKALSSRVCASTITFTYEHVLTDVVSGMIQRTVVRPDAITFDLPKRR